MNNLITIAGTKITEYRSAAEKAGELVSKKLLIQKHSLTRDVIFASANSTSDFSEYEKVLPKALCDYLGSFYGERVFRILDKAIVTPELLEKLCSHNPEIGVQVWYAVAHEHTRTVSDFMLRRTNIGYTKCKGMDAVDNVVSIMKEELKWTEDEAKRQKISYSESISRRDKSIPK